MADASSIFKSEFKAYIATFKKTSFDKKNGINLCQDETQKVYDFDEIVKKQYPKKQPSSYDALLIDNENIYCIEFKNEKYADIDRKKIHKKLSNGKEVLIEIFNVNHIPIDKYTFIYCVAYRNSPTKWRRGITKNIIQFDLEQYKGEYFDEIYTNDISYFTNEYKKQFTRTLAC